jgi:cyclopropane fatty-acyl-phospholipid synthase-like methyltransferase
MSLYKLGEQALAEGRNISRTLREHLHTERNTPEVIEVAYDLQAGTYVQFAEENAAYVRGYADQLAKFLNAQLEPGDAILDAGAGELTNLSHMVAALTVPLSKV